MEYCSRPPVFISFEEAAEEKLCSHCGHVMEIRQISLTEAVRQCFKCSTRFHYLEEDDIQYIHRSYEDIGKSPKDWKKCFTQHEEELEKIQKWFKQQNELLSKYLDSDDEDVQNEDCHGSNSKSSEQQKLSPAQPENGLQLLDIMDSFGPVDTLDKSQNIDFSWLDDFHIMNNEPNQKLKELPHSYPDVNNEQCSSTSYKELSFEAALSTSEQSVFLELCSSLGETLSNKFSSVSTADCNERQVKPESEEEHLPFEFQPQKSLPVLTGKHCPAYDTPNSGDVCEEYGIESEPTSQPVIAEQLAVSLDSGNSHQETSVENCMSSEEPLPVESVPTVDDSGSLSGHCRPEENVTLAECRPENNSSSALLPSLNTEAELELPGLVRLSFAIDFDDDADYKGTTNQNETCAPQSAETGDSNVSGQSARVDCLYGNMEHIESPALQFYPESTPTSNASKWIEHPDMYLTSLVGPLEVSSSFLNNTAVSPSRDPDYVILEIGNITNTRESKDVSEQSSVRSYHNRHVKLYESHDKKASSFQQPAIDLFDYYQVDHITEVQFSECTMESPLPNVPSTYNKLNIMPKYIWTPKNISSHMKSEGNVTQSVGKIPQNTNNEENYVGSCIPITIQFGNFTSTISVPSGTGESHLLSAKNPSGTIVTENSPHTSSDNMWATSVMSSEMYAESMPQWTCTSTEILPPVPAVSRSSRTYEFGAKKFACNRTFPNPLASAPVPDSEKTHGVCDNVSNVQVVTSSKNSCYDEDSNGNELKFFTGAKFKPKSERNFVIVHRPE